MKDAEIEEFRNNVGNYLPSFREIKHGYIHIFSGLNLKIILILSSILMLGLITYFFLPDTNTLFHIVRVIIIWPAFLIGGSLLPFVFIQPIFRFILQLLIGSVELIKMVLFVIQFIIYEILEHTIIGKIYEDQSNE